MAALKHLPVEAWPAADRAAWAAAFVEGDVFEETQGPGAHLAASTRRAILFAYRRWLGHLAARSPEVLAMPPAARITPERLRAYVEELDAGCTTTTTAIAVHGLCLAARLLALQADWDWLRVLRSALAARARPQDRFDRLQPVWRILDLGLALMARLPSHADWTPNTLRDYRDGLLLALLSLWPIRRRSVAALTVSGHVARRGDDLQLCLRAADTKGKRAEHYMVHRRLAPYLERYLLEVRPRFSGALDHDGLWASTRGRPLCDQQLYVIVRRRTATAFGRPMSLHDLRRSAATFLAIEAPALVGLIPGILQHAAPEAGEHHYNLARSTAASRRFASHVSDLRKRLRPPRRRPGG